MYLQSTKKARVLLILFFFFCSFYFENYVINVISVAKYYLLRSTFIFIVFKFLPLFFSLFYLFFCFLIIGSTSAVSLICQNSRKILKINLSIILTTLCIYENKLKNSVDLVRCYS